jgi:chemotaxis protein MotB
VQAFFYDGGRTTVDEAAAASGVLPVALTKVEAGRVGAP